MPAATLRQRVELDRLAARAGYPDRHVAAAEVLGGTVSAARRGLTKDEAHIVIVALLRDTQPDTDREERTVSAPQTVNGIPEKWWALAAGVAAFGFHAAGAGLFVVLGFAGLTVLFVVLFLVEVITDGVGLVKNLTGGVFDRSERDDTW